MSDEILSLKEQAEDLSMHLFWQQGYFNTSIDELVKVSGLSRAAIYKYFGGQGSRYLVIDFSHPWLKWTRQRAKLRAATVLRPLTFSLNEQSVYLPQ